MEEKGNSFEKAKRRMHPNSLKNLVNGNPNWVKGVTGNPNGQSLTKLLDDELKRIPTMQDDGIDGKGRTNAQLLIKSQVRDARCKDNQARKEIWERKEGKVPQAIVGVKDNPVQVEFLNLLAGLRGYEKGTE